MKNITKKLLAGLILLPFLSMGARAQQDKYAVLANELIEAGAEFQGKKIAVIPFSYADNRTGATKDGAVISERLTMKLINKHKFEIVERAMLDKVMGELKLQSSGIMDASSTQQLGKLLGVQAIVTGTLIETSNGQIEVNARMIKTETAQAVGASQVSVQKDWIGDAATPQPAQTYQQPQQPQYQPQPEYTPAPQKRTYVTAPRPRGEYEYGYFDVFGGLGTQTTTIEFDPSLGGTELKNLVTRGAGPLGFRVGGYGNGPIGGDFEFSISKHYVEAQRVPVSGTSFYVNVPAGYIDATSIGMSGDLLLRTMTKAQFYLGVGLGLSINNIKSSTIRDVHNLLLNETAVGFMFRVPIGVRFNMDNTTFFLEGRMEMNATTFTAGTPYTNNLSFIGARGVFGVGTKF